MGTVSIVRAWPCVVALWLVALSAQAEWRYPTQTASTEPMPNSGSNRYWFKYTYPAGGTGTGTGVASVTVASPNSKTFQVAGGVTSGPGVIIYGWAQYSSPTTVGWAFTPQGGAIATESGGTSFVMPWSQSPLSVSQLVGFNWPASGIPITEIGTGNPVDWDGNVTVPPPTETIQDHKIGFSLTNSGADPKDYYIQPTDMNGNPLPDLPFQKVTLAPGESRSFSFSRPGTGAGGAGGAFKVDVIQTDWVADPEFGVVKQESLTGTWNSVPKVVPINNVSPTPSQQSSSGGSTAPQPDAPVSQTGGDGGLSGAQANTLNQNTLAELRRLGATVKAAGDVAHSDAQQIMGKLGALAAGGEGAVDMSGVEDKLDSVKGAIDAVKGALDNAAGQSAGPLTGPGPPATPGDGIEEAEGDTSYLGGIGQKLDVAKGRLGLAVLQFKSARNALPTGSGVSPLDFTIQTQRFGTIHMNFSAYEGTLLLVRSMMLLVITVGFMTSAGKALKQAFV